MFVGGIPFSATQEDIRSFFSTHGCSGIQDVRLAMKDSDGYAKVRSHRNPWHMVVQLSLLASTGTRAIAMSLLDLQTKLLQLCAAVENTLGSDGYKSN